MPITVTAERSVSVRCETCGDLPDFSVALKVWGQAHVNRYPSHEVILTTKTTERIVG